MPKKRNKRNIGGFVRTCPVHKKTLKPFRLDYSSYSSGILHVRAGYCRYCQCFYIDAPECKESKFYINQGLGHTKIKQINKCSKNQYPIKKKRSKKQQQIMNILSKGTRIKNNKHEIGTIIERNEKKITVSYPDSKEVKTYSIPYDFINGSISLLRHIDNERFMAFIGCQNLVVEKLSSKNVGYLIKNGTDKIEYNVNGVQQSKLLKITKTSRKDIRSLDNIVYKFQLIGSTHNHYSTNHNVTNRTINLAYVDNDGTISIIELLAHYCFYCNKYFDFEESFTLQLQEHHLKIDRFLTRFEDRFSKPIEFENEDFNEYSKLRLFGYHVGAHGLSDNSRHDLLNFLLTTGLMTAPEIKNMLQFYIRFNGKKKIDMTEAICDWKSDIKYVNNWILNKGTS